MRGFKNLSVNVHPLLPFIRLKEVLGQNQRTCANSSSISQFPGSMIEQMLLLLLKQGIVSFFLFFSFPSCPSSSKEAMNSVSKASQTHWNAIFFSISMARIPSPLCLMEGERNWSREVIVKNCTLNFNFKTKSALFLFSVQEMQSKPKKRKFLEEQVSREQNEMRHLLSLLQDQMRVSVEL